MIDTLAPPDPATQRLTADEWVIQWRGRRWTSAELTGRHLAVVSELLGVAPPWSMLDVRALHPALGPLQTMTLIAAFTIVADDVHGRPAMLAVLETVKDASATELVEAIEIAED